MTHSILLINVGQQEAPVINCIRSRRPDRVVFLCSEATRAKVDVVLSQVRIRQFDAEQDVVVFRQRTGRGDGHSTVNELDSLECVYIKAWGVIQQLHQQHSGAHIAVDYTAGTKTMATGLAMAAVDDGRVQILLTTSQQRPNGGEHTGATVPTPASIAAIQVSRLLHRELPPLLARYDYAAAEALVHQVRTASSVRIEDGFDLLRLEHLLQAFDAWDRFDHRQAQVAFDQVRHNEHSSRWLLHLKRVMGSRLILDAKSQGEGWSTMNGHGLESVEDLLLNAQRRAEQERYDDAVGRLYRGLELTAQILLRQGVCEQVGAEGLMTDNLAVDRLPSDLQARFADRSRPVKIGLTESWSLLAGLHHPAGQLWETTWSARIDNQLQHRNNSLFAHGFQPITYAAWKQMSEVVFPFLDAVITNQRTANGPEPLSQFPSSLEDLQPTAGSTKA